VHACVARLRRSSACCDCVWLVCAGASHMGSDIAAGLAGGNITQSAIDESVTRILTGMFRYYCVLYQHVAAEQQVL
jgi:hypothetical protein